MRSAVAGGGWWVLLACACLAAGDAVAKDKERPERGGILEVVLLRGDAVKGCATDLATTNQDQATFRCGRIGAMAEITWRFLRRSQEGDVYAITRIYPLGSPHETRESRQVTYAGKEVRVFADEEQRVLLRPRTPRD